jgi:hypothetical protein
MKFVRVEAFIDAEFREDRAPMFIARRSYYNVARTQDMITPQSLVQRVGDFTGGAMTLLSFQIWYEGNCVGTLYTQEGSLSEACADIDSAMAAYSVGDLDETELKKELASAIRSLQPTDTLEIVTAN